MPPNTDKPLLLFDGECNLCNGWVKFVLKHEVEPQIQFATLQSDYGQEILVEHGLPQKTLDTVVYVEDGKAMIRSTAVLTMVRHLRMPYRLGMYMLWIPRVFRDIGYRLVASTRYYTFGKTDQCMIPTPETRARFLS